MIHINWATECSECGREFRSERRIFEQTQELAAKFYLMLGYTTNKGFRFDLSEHPTEQAMWEMAKLAQDMLTQTDVDSIDPDDLE